MGLLEVFCCFVRCLRGFRARKYENGTKRMKWGYLSIGVGCICAKLAETIDTKAPVLNGFHKRTKINKSIRYVACALYVTLFAENRAQCFFFRKVLRLLGLRYRIQMSDKR